MPNRYVCSALEELRTLLELMFESHEVPRRRILAISTLIEEIQVYVNRMESSLGDNWDMIKKQEQLSELKKEVRELRKKKNKLAEEVGADQEEVNPLS